jgi:SAM-dependent methyltransferase
VPREHTWYEPAMAQRLKRSDYLSWFAHMGAVYLFHDLYGYLMEMSADIADMIETFSGAAGADPEQVVATFRTRLEGADPQQFVEILTAHSVLLELDEDEVHAMWAFVPIKGKWNVWQRRDDRLVLVTAWGERPVQELFLDPEETRMWDAFDGEKRLVELKLQHDPDKLQKLARRLIHSDVQALKLSMMPWSTYAKRPGIAPRYLASTMPFQPWRPGTPVPPAVGLTEYYKHEVHDANEQFDHQETTLSHLLRVPHPALANRTYGQALIDTLLTRGVVPEGRVRVLEIGAGLAYVARDVIERLRAAGREVTYTIVELSPALAAAQRERLGTSAQWIAGDALAVTVPEAAFDLVLSNEMVGDLPAKEMMHVDPLPPIAADAGITTDDVAEPFYLQVGAFELVARIARWLAPGGTAVVTEFGDRTQWPKLSTHLDHPELSTHFGHLAQVGKHAGLVTEIEFVIDMIDLDRDQQGLATTRSHFRALRALAADAGVDLAKIGYTRALLEHAVAGKLDLSLIGDLRWDRIEDRLMGLVPHEFKALVARRPR